MSLYSAQGAYPNQIAPGLPPYSAMAGYFPGTTGLASYGSGTPGTAAKAFFGFFSPPVNATISALALYLFTGQTGAKARLGAYSNVGGLPSALLADFGEVDLSGSAGIVEAGATTLNVSPSQGGVWICTWMKNVATQATVAGSGPAPLVYPLSPSQISAGTNIRGYSATAAYPANLPSTAPAVGTEVTGSNGVPLAWVKVQ